MLNKNDKVKINGTKIYGKIKGISNKKAMLKTSDFKTITVPIEKLIKEDYPDEDIKVNINYSHDIKETSNEIMLRHLTKEVAIEKLELFISKCIMNKIFTIKIIHGKNGGILREAVHKYLSSSPYIQEFHLAGYFEGQYGVTIATIKR